jgi:2-iminobutanoate/2-iminopropanoate deaminase
MPKKEIITTDRVAAGSAPLSQATRFGNLVFVQGCTGRHPTSDHVEEGIKDQTRHALQRISAILEAAGSSLDQVLTNTCYVTKREDLPGFNEVYSEFFPMDRPARTTVVVNFGSHDNLVEITSTAGIPD